jgi:hypothetical protein
MSPRIVVLQAESFPDPDPPWLPVGVCRWAGSVERLVVVLKATFVWDASGHLEWAPEQMPLSRGEPSRLAGASAREIHVPDDFVPRKAGVDVLVHGHARARTPSAQLDGAVRAGALRHAFRARAAAPVTALPLTSTYLEPHEPLGGLAAPRFDERSPFDDALDPAWFNAAPPSQRVAELPPRARVELLGLARDGEPQRFAAPELAPWVTRLGGRDDGAVEMRCDTVWIDADEGLCVVTWRGAFEVDRSRDVDRLVVSMERAGAERTPEARRAALQRGRFGFAASMDDPLGHDARDERERDRIAMARYATWQSAAPPPRLSLERYATLAATLADRSDRRAATLQDHGLDEDRFLVEERAWLEKIARSAMDGDAGPANELGERYLAAQAALDTPDLSMADYAELAVAIDRADVPDEALKARGLSLPQWMRIERKWQDAAAEPPVLEELERLVAEARIRAGQAGP